MSETYDYLRLIFATAGISHCPDCARPMTKIKFATKKQELQAKDKFTCPKCQRTAPEITISSFSFNSPTGACPHCHGLGTILKIDPRLVIPNPKLTIAEGAIRPWQRMSSGSVWQNQIIEKLAEKHKFNFQTPIFKMPVKTARLILFGEGDEEFEGVVQNLERRYRETGSEYIKQEIEKYMVNITCSVCSGNRLKPEVLAVKIGDLSIVEMVSLTTKQLIKLIDDIQTKKIKLEPYQYQIASQAFEELKKRLNFMQEVGLDYLTLSRSAQSLSGGEAQRIRLATQLGSGLTGVIYILDEPSIGLHPRDQKRLLNAILKLKEQGNTVIVVEHDEQTIRAADWIVDIGPGAGENGGEIIATGEIDDIIKTPKSLTGQYLSHKKQIPMPKNHRLGISKSIEIKGAAEFNLKNIDVSIPLGKFVCITGVSGSGKSTLITNILANKLENYFYGAKVKIGKHKDIIGLENINKVIHIDQSPIGRNVRSNPSTYTGLLSLLRELYSQLDEAKKMRLTPAHFSFNLRGGRCETCRGDGLIKFEMHFLPNVYIPCQDCQGKRYKPEILEIKYQDHSISDVLKLTVDQASDLFFEHPMIIRKLDILKQVGLGYIQLGQPAVTLSGGEAQRVKLAAELSRSSTGKTLYILDEPTTGLHFEDIAKLLKVIHKLVDNGNTIIAIEHNLEIIKNADWVIDLGPDGGEDGGQVVAEGTPEQVARSKQSHTAEFLKKVL